MMLFQRSSFNWMFAAFLLLAPVHGRAGPTLSRGDGAAAESTLAHSSALNGTLLAACAAHRGPDGLFIRGLHHGGTSLLSKLIALHPDVSPISSGKLSYISQPHPPYLRLAH